MGTQRFKCVLICLLSAQLVQDVEGTIPIEISREAAGCSKDDIAVVCDNVSQIAISSIKYGFKPVYLSCPENATASDSCCSVTSDDCLQDAPSNDSTYVDALSGRNNANLPQPPMLPMPLGNCDVNLTYADEPILSLLEYLCIPDEKIQSGCLSIRDRTDTLPLYIQNGNYPNWGATATCNCSIDVPYNANITMYVIHLDMYNGTTSCLQNITLEGADSMMQIGCDTPQFNTIQNVTIPKSYIIVKMPNAGKFWLGFQASKNGSMAILNCPAKQPIDCYSPPSLGNGNYTVTSTRYGGEAHYKCNLGYNMTSGNDVISCAINGSWIGTTPTCINAGIDTSTNDCGYPGNNPNGIISISGTTVGSTANYTCEMGYNIGTGSSTRVCMEDGTWSGNTPTCEIRGVVPYGEKVKKTTECYSNNLSAVCTNGTIAVSSFASGFKVSSAHCQVDGTANGSCCTYNNNTDCLQENAMESRYVDTLSGKGSGVISTSSVAPIPGGVCDSNSLSAVSVFSTLEYICLDDDRITTMCSSVSYTNSEDLPSYLQNLNYPDGILNTDMSCTCSVEINEFTTIDMYILHLDLNDTPEQCKQNITIFDGEEKVLKVFQCEPHPFNTIVRETLDSTYLKISMMNSVPSTNSGKFWFGFQDTKRNASLTINCPSQQQRLFLGCSDLSDPDGGYVNVTSTSYAGIATYTCKPGNVRVAGDVTRTCQRNNTWSGQNVTCSPVNENGTIICEMLDNPKNGQVNAPNYTLGDEATYSCNENYTIASGDITRVCQMNGSWSGEMINCVPKGTNTSTTDCGNLDDIHNGDIVISGTTVGSTANYSCVTGYNIGTGSSTRVCQEDGTWSGNAPTCGIVDCGRPLTITNGNINYGTTTYGSLATYSCIEKYVLDGNPSIDCQADGIWSGPQPTCAFECNKLEDPENGQITYSADPPRNDDIATFTCNDMFTINGSMSITCSEPIGWTPAPPSCTMKEGTQGTDGKGNEKGSALVPVLVTLLVVILLLVLAGGIWYKKKGDGYFKFGNNNENTANDGEHKENNDEMKDAEKGDSFELDGLHGVELDNTSVDEEEARKADMPPSATANATAYTKDETKKDCDESKVEASPTDDKMGLEPVKANGDKTDPDKDIEDETNPKEEGNSTTNDEIKLSASDDENVDKSVSENTNDTGGNDTEKKDKRDDENSDVMIDKKNAEKRDEETKGELEFPEIDTEQNGNETSPDLLVDVQDDKKTSVNGSELSAREMTTENGEKEDASK